MKTVLSAGADSGTEVELGSVATGVFQGREYPLDEPPAGAGVYLMARRRTVLGVPTILYVGESEELRVRLVPSHEKMEPAVKLGANRLLIIRENNAQTRLAIEDNVRRHYDPPLNKEDT